MIESKAKPLPPRTAVPIDKVGRYRAPALEKGLDILELLAQAPDPLTLSQISQRLGRSSSELFRMIQVLESRGYVDAPVVNEGYVLTDKAFSLAAHSPGTPDFFAQATPFMQLLCDRTGQACHLVVASGDQIVVVARQAAPGNPSLSLNIGFRRDIVGSTSGLALYAFQPQDIRLKWQALLAPQATGGAWQAFDQQAEQVRRQGYARGDSTFTAGVVDLSCPILVQGQVMAALTIPFINHYPLLPVEDSLKQLMQIAGIFSRDLNFQAGR